MTAEEPKKIDIKDLQMLAIYLEGIYKGQGNLLPLGRSHLDNLWNTIEKLNKEAFKPITPKQL